jgi:transposase
MTRKAYPSDVSDDEWALVMPYLVLMDPKAPQRTYDLREMFNALRYVVRTGGQWRMLPNDLPPGQLSTSRCSVGSMPRSLKPWSMTYDYC